MPPWSSGDNMTTLSLDEKIEARKKERRRGRKRAKEKHGGDNVVDLPRASAVSGSHEADAITSSALDEKIEARKRERRRGRKHSEGRDGGNNVVDLPRASTDSGPHEANAITSSALDEKIEARKRERRRGRKHSEGRDGGNNVVDPRASTESGSHEADLKTSSELDKRIKDKMKARRRKKRPQRAGEAETPKGEVTGKGTEHVVTYELKNENSPDGAEELLSAIVEGSEYSGSNAFSGVPSSPSRDGPLHVTKNDPRQQRKCGSDDAREIAADFLIDQDRIGLARQKSLEAKMPLDELLNEEEMKEPGVGTYKKARVRRLSIEHKLPFDISIERGTDESSDTNERPMTPSEETDSASESAGQVSTSTANSSRVTASKSERPSLQSSGSSRLLVPPANEPDESDSSSESFFSEEDFEDEDIAGVSRPNKRAVDDFSESSEESSYVGSNPSTGTMAASHLGSVTSSNNSLLSLRDDDDDDLSIADDRSRDGDGSTRRSDSIGNGEHDSVANERTMGMLGGKRDVGIQRYIQARMSQSNDTLDGDPTLGSDLEKLNDESDRSDIADSDGDDSMSTYDEVANSDSGDSMSSYDEDTPLNSRTKPANMAQLDAERGVLRKRSDTKQRKSVTFGQSETLFDRTPGSPDVDLDPPNQPGKDLSADPRAQSSLRNSSSTLPIGDETEIYEKDLERDRKFEEFYEDQISRAKQDNDATSDTDSRTESLISKDSDVSISEDSSIDSSSSDGETSSDDSEGSSEDDSSSSSEDYDGESESDDISSSAELDEKYMSLLSSQFTGSKDNADSSLRSGNGSSREAGLDSSSSANRVRSPDDPRFWSKSVQGTQQGEPLERSMLSLKSAASGSNTDRKFRRSQFSQNTTQTGSTSKSNNTAKTHGSSETIKMQSNLLDESNRSRRSRRSDMSGLSVSDSERKGLPGDRRHGGSSSSRHDGHETSSRRSRQGSTSSSRRSHNSTSSRRSGDSGSSPTRRQGDNDSTHSMDSGRRLNPSSYSRDSSQSRSSEQKESTRSDKSLQDLALNDSLREAYLGSTVGGTESELPVTRRMSNTSGGISYPVVNGTAVAIVGDDQAKKEPKRAKKLFKMLSIDTRKSNSQSRARRTLFGRRDKSSHQFNQSEGSIFANDFNESFSSALGAALDRSVSKMSFSRRRPSVDKRRPSVDDPVDSSIASFRSLPSNSRQSLIAQQQQALRMRQESLAREINAFNALINPNHSRGDSFAGNATFHMSTNDVGWQEVSQSSHGRSADTITSLLGPTQLPHTSPALRRYKSQTIRDRNGALIDRRASFDEYSHGGNHSSEPTSSSESFHRRSSTSLSTHRSSRASSFQRSSIGSYTYRSSERSYRGSQGSTTMGTRNNRESNIRTNRSPTSTPTYGSHPNHRFHRSMGSVASVGSNRSDPYHRSRSSEFITSPRGDSVPSGSRRNNLRSMSRSPHSPRSAFANPPPQHRNTRRDAGAGLTWGDLDGTIQSAIQSSVQDLSTSVYTSQAWIPVAVEVNQEDDTQGDETLSAACSRSNTTSTR